MSTEKIQMVQCCIHVQLLGKVYHSAIPRGCPTYVGGLCREPLSKADESLFDGSLSILPHREGVGLS